MPRQTVDRTELARLIAAVKMALPSEILEPLAVYLEMLCQWNSVVNLVGLRAWQEILTKLVADSFYLSAFLTRLPFPENAMIWDLGSGAGLPGLPLRLVRPRGVYCFVERREKRALFLSNVLSRLRLPDTRVFRGPAEQFFQTRRCRPADCIVSRAFMPWRALLDLTLPHLRPSGALIVLALTRAPDSPPGPWRVTAVQSYTIAGNERWFWALTPSGA
ncbi:16S rRNA (guanine(527)-N(7))-methyltransferase RsmG [Candidatus Desulfovibrio trichonymphae]|uniref:Ribosomal RNA small subunit methyltransferase G n=1 Tax=Candidatus Desulfovibrio trichonymphae TaxID=1725232 RepID=A0A1J1E2Q7_9BACT|nr:RsmG family class I SAM-dependent methyltransferase [Candidatus Desulfovibrio trichonymphae]BAV91712.1 ribosomal RNA small subunit methyltransferase G [Candidatus Desulfovibrio trichonymphae]GHU95674.1 ribosomal RNA small subunit methyltransferase G [Deltaproteobacteria bacterium]GHU99525.1 ribosomal RNA small subunit methyltransferase G [Deltaproteobacteria bacterium]